MQASRRTPPYIYNSTTAEAHDIELGEGGILSPGGGGACGLGEGRAPQYVRPAERDDAGQQAARQRAARG